jgi:WD40 repeat protein
VIAKVLDAPDVMTQCPAKLIDFNRKNQLAVALGAAIYIWEDERVTQLMEADSDITSLCWADDHLMLSARGEVELWDVNQGAIIQQMTRHSGRCCAMGFGGHRVATGGADAIVNVADVRHSGESQFAGHHGEIVGLAWSPDGVHLSSAGSDSRVFVWGDRQRRVYNITAPISALCYFTPTGLAVGQSIDGGTMQLLSGQQEEGAVSITTGAPISSIAFSDNWGIFVGHRQTSFQWDLWSPELRRMGQYSGHTADILNLIVASDGSLAATIGGDETLQLWQLRDGKARTPSFQRKGPRMPSPLLLR